MFEGEFAVISRFIVLLLAGGCLGFQKYLRKHMSREQYDYIRDVMLLCAWVVVALWSGSETAREVVATALLACAAGFVSNRSPHNISWIYLLIGFLFAFWGERIAFVGMPQGQYLFLHPLLSHVITALWMGFFPLLMVNLDRIPGMAGHLLLFVWLLMAGVTGFSGQDLQGAVTMCLGGIGLLGVFWSRHGHLYRRLGEPLAAFWGTLVAGVSVMGVSKGIAFSALMLLPLALFAIPIMEVSLNFVSRALSPAASGGNVFMYRRLVDRGVDHPDSVRMVAFLSGALGFSAAVLQIRPDGQGAVVAFFGVFAAVAYVGTVLRRSRRRRGNPSPSLWRVPINSVSLHYALGKAWALISNGDPRGFTVFTPNALSVYAARKDPELVRAFRNADLSLPDGMGLVLGLRFLGFRIHERIAGVEFMEQLCRTASYAKWPVFFLGGEPGVASRTAEVLQKKYPGLSVAGWHHGFFEEHESSSICEKVCDSGAKILFVALGVPRQEKWIAAHEKELPRMFRMGVGGSFDVLSGKLQRAPRWMRRMGLEWFFRLCQEPWRWRRMAKLPLFVLWVLAARFGIGNRRDGVKR